MIYICNFIFERMNLIQHSEEFISLSVHCCQTNSDENRERLLYLLIESINNDILYGGSPAVSIRNIIKDMLKRTTPTVWYSFGEDGPPVYMGILKDALAKYTKVGVHTVDYLHYDDLFIYGPAIEKMHKAANNILLRIFGIKND